MNELDRRFWPFKPRASIAATILTLVALVVVLIILQGTLSWPDKESQTMVLVGVLLLSLLPILLALVDVIIERGAVIEYAGLKIDLSQVPKLGVSTFTVPGNIGVPGQSVTDSSTTEILDALRKSTSCDVVIIDLEAGQAWWETRLLVLLAGAVRLKKPEKVVFVGLDGGLDKSFQGWSHSNELLPHLLKAHPQYALSYYTALAAALQWALVEPIGAGIAAAQPPAAAPAGPPPWPGLATRHPWMAFNQSDGLPNELLAEQLLQSDLGENIEQKKQARSISLVRLEELFRPVLHKESIDGSWPAERQVSVFFDGKDDYIAITQNSQYTTLVSRLAVLNTMLRKFVQKDQRGSGS
jgi:hypothetical protein